MTGMRAQGRKAGSRSECSVRQRPPIVHQAAHHSRLSKRRPATSAQSHQQGATRTGTRAMSEGVPYVRAAKRWQACVSYWTAQAGVPPSLPGQLRKSKSEPQQYVTRAPGTHQGRTPSTRPRNHRNRDLRAQAQGARPPPPWPQTPPAPVRRQRRHPARPQAPHPPAAAAHPHAPQLRRPCCGVAAACHCARGNPPPGRLAPHHDQSLGAFWRQR